MKVRATISIHDEYMHLEVPDELFEDAEEDCGQKVYDFIEDKFFEYLKKGGSLGLNDIEYDEIK